ncbi:ComEC/Rec2 family competence protein [Candidatus Roizmanbacteria bacterium]|nr:ComEC/Rec2 family competence protein [Candidatus Roizmanbacteria bacterium]
MTVDIFTSVIDKYLGEPHASLANGILFGVNLKPSGELYSKLKTVGLLHMVVLSGTNISLLCSLVASLTAHFGKYISIMITTLVVFCFIYFVGLQAPVVRTGLMTTFTFVTIILGRKTEPIIALFVSLLVIAVFFPDWLSSVSLYLSYAATLGIIVARKNDSGQHTNFLKIIKNELYTSFFAQLFTAPIIFLAFRQISLLSPISTLFVGWIVSPIMLFGFITVILGKVNFLLGYPAHLVVYVLTSYALIVINLFNRFPYALISIPK